MSFDRVQRDDPFPSGFGALDRPYADAVLDGYGGAPAALPAYPSVTGTSPLPAQAKADGGAVAAQAPATTGSGQALEAETRSDMERSFATSFADVRVHHDGAAEQLGAQAYAQGNDLHFAAGRYQPQTESGRSLIGHELAHVVQQRAGAVSTPQAKGAVVNADPALESEADLAGERAARGEPAGLGRAAGGGGGDVIQRKGEASTSTASLDSSADEESLDSTTTSTSTQSAASSSSSSSSGAEAPAPNTRDDAHRAMVHLLEALHAALRRATLGSYTVTMPRLKAAVANLPHDFEVDLLSGRLTALCDEIEGLAPFDRSRFERHEKKGNAVTKLGRSKPFKRHRGLMKATGGLPPERQPWTKGQEWRATVFGILTGTRRLSSRAEHHRLKALRLDAERRAAANEIAEQLEAKHAPAITHLWTAISRRYATSFSPDNVDGAIAKLTVDRLVTGQGPADEPADEGDEDLDEAGDDVGGDDVGGDDTSDSDSSGASDAATED